MMHNKKIYIFFLIIHDLYLDISYFSSHFAYLMQYFMSNMQFWEVWDRIVVCGGSDVTTKGLDIILYKSSVHNKNWIDFTQFIMVLNM